MMTAKEIVEGLRSFGISDPAHQQRTLEAARAYLEQRPQVDHSVCDSNAEIARESMAALQRLLQAAEADADRLRAEVASNNTALERDELRATLAKYARSGSQLCAELARVRAQLVEANARVLSQAEHEERLGHATHRLGNLAGERDRARAIARELADEREVTWAEYCALRNRARAEITTWPKELE